MTAMRYYSQLGIGSFFSFKNDLLNILELYLADFSESLKVEKTINLYKYWFVKY